MIRRLSSVGLALAFTLAATQPAESQQRSVCMTGDPNTCVTFDGFNWVSGGAGSFTFSADFTFYGFNAPDVFSIWWNQSWIGAASGDYDEIGIFVDNIGGSLTGGQSGAYSLTQTFTSFVEYGDFGDVTGGSSTWFSDYSVYNPGVTPDTVWSGATPGTPADYSRFEVVNFSSGLTNCEPIGLITFKDPEGNELQAVAAGIFAFFQAPNPTNPCDNVTTGVVPEPATMLLLGTGLLGVGVAARRRRLEDEYGDEY